MTKLFYMGGPLFMGILTILFLILLATAIYLALTIYSGKAHRLKNFTHKLTYLRSIGLFSLVTGVLGQFIGLMMAFEAIEKSVDISPAIMAGGLKVSMITTLYGILIYLVSILIWFLLDLWYQKNLNSYTDESD